LLAGFPGGRERPDVRDLHVTVVADDEWLGVHEFFGGPPDILQYSKAKF
jgi:hypothetical protein